MTGNLPPPGLLPRWLRLGFRVRRLLKQFLFQHTCPDIIHRHSHSGVRAMTAPLSSHLKYLLIDLLVRLQLRLGLGQVFGERGRQNVLRSSSGYEFQGYVQDRLTVFVVSYRTGIAKPRSDRKRPPGRPNHTWLRAIESDLRPLNIGPFYARKKAASRKHWRSVVDTATPMGVRTSGQMGSADPWKNEGKIKKRKHAKRAVF